MNIQVDLGRRGDGSAASGDPQVTRGAASGTFSQV